MSSYKINFKQIRQSNISVFEALERALKNIEVDFYLIGAQSRDVWINHLDLKEKRTTADIDYLVYIKDHNTWNELIKYLTKEENFKQDEKLPYRFYQDGIVDLIPFGEIEEDGEVVLENLRTELSVVGCKEVAENETITEGYFKIIKLPGLCILKLIAYGEKPDNRAKDFDDYLFLVRNYHEIAGDELFMGNYDDLIEDDFDLMAASARMLGRHLKPTLNSNESLKNKILSVLKGKLMKFKHEEIDEMYLVDKEDSTVIRLKLISETIKGIND